MTDITIPPEALEAAARKIAAVKMLLANDGEHLPDDLWKQCLPEASAALLAGLKAWPKMHTGPSPADARRNSIILPLPLEEKR